MENTQSELLFSVEKALRELQKKPNTKVHATLCGVEVEMRIAEKHEKKERLGDLLASLGPWSGESPDELSRFLAESRMEGGSAEPPVL